MPEFNAPLRDMRFVLHEVFDAPALWARLPALACDDLGLGDASLGVYAWALISDHQLQRSQLVFHPALPATERERLVALFEHDAPTAAGAFRLAAPMRADGLPLRRCWTIGARFGGRLPCGNRPVFNGNSPRIPALIRKRGSGRLDKLR